MRGVFIVFGSDLYDDSVGENRKIIAQRNAFVNNGFDCDYVVLDIHNNSILDKLLYRLPFTNINPKWKFCQDFYGCSYIYFRRPYMMSYAMYHVLKRIRKCNENILIMMEIPTYPYDAEIIYRKKYGFLNYPILWKDRFWRKRVKEVIDYIVSPSGDGYEDIWGIPVLNIGNGIPLDKYEKKRASQDSNLNLLAVANFKEWHGYERVIRALGIYYEKQHNENVILHMVGEGTELEEYKCLVKKLNLTDNVIFYGRKKLDELNKIYDKCDIGLGSFGAYKKGILRSKELKSREYLAKGLPIVSGCPIDVFQNDSKYCLEFPNDSSDICIEKIVDFYKGLRVGRDKEELICEVRRFAEDKIGIDKSMEQVINIMRKLMVEE